LRLLKFDPREIVHECLRNSFRDVNVESQILLDCLPGTEAQFVNEPNADALNTGGIVDIRKYPPDFLGLLREFIPSTVGTQPAEYEPIRASLDSISTAFCSEAPPELFLLHIHGCRCVWAKVKLRLAERDRFAWGLVIIG
jgi:hypothetical protein